MFEDFIIDDEPNVTPRDITGTIGDVSCLNSLPDVPSFADAISKLLPPSITDTYGESRTSISLLESLRLQYPSHSTTFETPWMGSHGDEEITFIKDIATITRSGFAGESSIEPITG
ncbi:hypothetical protein CVT25_015719 [Psilocybe cyanescens]|uniref:Uncharacterized protein n=1 Tax=Psilocybe cyanescens TaxID=93625 RepID=A0A409X1L1_PSICY|nr:hypothetical protein CVT25_015719 [Psilocybe cyanescens]